MVVTTNGMAVGGDGCISVPSVQTSCTVCGTERVTVVKAGWGWTWVCLSLSIISCSVVWETWGGGPMAHYPVSLQALYITAIAWQVLEHYKLSWQTLSFFLPLTHPLSWVQKNHGAQWRREQEAITLSFPCSFSASLTFTPSDFISQWCPLMPFLDTDLISKPVNLTAKVK